MDTVVLIDPLDVPEGSEDEFLHQWDATVDLMRTKEGFVHAQLARTMGAEATVRFLSMTEWESVRAFLAAATELEARGLRTPQGHPSLYGLARSVSPNRRIERPVAAA